MTPTKHRILAIDDQPSNLLTLRAALGADFLLQVATSGAAGLSLAAQEHPDLILLDVMMPEMDGYETCRRLKADPDLCRIPVIFVTALGDNAAERTGLALDAVDYITKPINVEIARLRIINQLEREVLRKEIEAQRDRMEHLNQELSVALSAARASEEATRRGEAELRKLLRAVEQSPSSIVITDRGGRIEYVNASFEALTGYTSAEVLGRNPRFLKSGMTSAETYRELWRLIPEGGTWRGELSNRSKDGQLFWEHAAISGLKDENGKVTHYIAVKEDITGRKQTAEALWQMRRHEVEIGAIIQNTLLQGKIPADIEGAWVAAFTEPSQGIDGDFHTIRRYHPTCFEVLVGDVMGKGVQAALMGAGIMTAYSQSLTDLLVSGAGAQNLPTPAQIVNAMHLALTPQLMALSSFATLVLYRFDLEAGTLTYVNAGHTPGLLMRGGDGLAEQIMGDNLPIGVMADENYVQITLAVAPGDSLLVFSDGITEACNAAGEEFGLERLSGLLGAGHRADLPPAAMMNALLGEVRRFTGGVPTTDDRTAFMVGLRERRGPLRGRLEERVKPFVFSLPWKLEGLARLRTHIRASAWSLPAADVDALILASFEAATNIIRHARLLVGDAKLICKITREGQAVVVELIYPSPAFTPPAVIKPDFSGASEGGFGLYIIEQSVDSVDYSNPMPGMASIRLVKRASTASA
jgi:PAS domain S-box-containing protein